MLISARVSDPGELALPQRFPFQQSLVLWLQLEQASRAHLAHLAFKPITLPAVVLQGHKQRSVKHDHVKPGQRRLNSAAKGGLIELPLFGLEHGRTIVSEFMLGTA